MLRKNDIFNALLTYRSTPLKNGYSPSRLLMGRRLQTQLPTLQANLYPNVLTNDRQWVDEKEIGPINSTTLISDRVKELPTLEFG